MKKLDKYDIIFKAIETTLAKLDKLKPEDNICDDCLRFRTRYDLFLELASELLYDGFDTEILKDIIQDADDMNEWVDNEILKDSKSEEAAQASNI